jgi:predicted nucleic acid-binding protein
VRFYVSQYILDELAETLVEDLGCTRRYASLACRAVQRIAKVVETPIDVARHVPSDPDDDPIVQTALSGKVHYLVTADKEILQLGKVRDVEILTALQFEERLEQPRRARHAGERVAQASSLSCLVAAPKMGFGWHGDGRNCSVGARR